MNNRQRKILAVGLAVTVMQAACAGAGPRPDLERDFHGGRAAHLAWYEMLLSRYGCDTVLVNARAGPELATGVTVCAAAEKVVPDAVRAWTDSTEVREEWEYLGLRGGNTVGVTLGPRWDPAGRCRVTLQGRNPRDLRVSNLAC